MVETRHFSTERLERRYLIEYVIKDTNNVICTCVKDRGHKDGPERFELTDKGIIKVYNNITNRHVTDLVARPKQIVDRFGVSFRSLSIELQNEVLTLAREHQRLGYNV
jgi:hypothetical protein